MNKMRTMNLASIENENARKNFYPTPPALADKLMQGIDWNFAQSVLEPSAGKGDLARVAANKMYNARRGFPVYDEHSKQEALEQADIDCVEIDSFLRSQLENTGFRVVHDDFLTFETQKRYDLILMNPPFDRGAEHLLHALELIEHGGTVRCILNAETIRNPCTPARQRLLKALETDSSIEYVSDAFADAERSTGVEIAIVHKTVARKKPDSTIMEDMRKAPTYKTQETPQEYAEIVRYNQIEEWVNRYNYEVACGIRLIEEYEAMIPHILDRPSDKYASPILELKLHAGGHDRDARINAYIRQTRRKYWSMIFQQESITQRLTSNLINELHDSVNALMDYDFSVYNILTLVIKMNGKVINGMEDTIVQLFDEWTARCWNEDSPNRHYYDGWKTNDCFSVGKKVIIPFYDAFSNWDKRFSSWRVASKFRDIEKVFDFLDSGRTDWPGDIESVFRIAETTQNTRNIDTKYFTVTFFKKGTAHLAFKDMELLEKFNLFAGQKKGWLPPSYGKKKYADMNAEEQRVVDSFQGRERYEYVMSHADYYLDTGAHQPLMLASGMEG